ncbi:MAG: T9SS type A sorting domain-containing protein [Saprospiraceae bacterium]|nr:T9SS type A sorting domain-containing protein [Saprospiraceae bacterium]
MKIQSFFLCLFLLTGGTAFSQNWHLITPGSKYNFQFNTAAYVSNTIRVDSAATLGADSVFWLSQPRGLYTIGYPYIVIVGNLLGDSVVKHADFSYECRFRLPLWPEYAQETFVIRAHAEPGESWEFKSGIMATVSEKKDTLCWGVSDSLKTIELSDGKRLRLSKHFGLLFSENQTLVGLQGKNKGIQLPVLADFYSDWVAGAVFELYQTQSENYGTSQAKIWTKYDVLGHAILPDTIKINVRKLVRKETSFSGGAGPTTFENVLTTLSIPHPGKVMYPGLFKEAAYSDFTNILYQPTDQGLKMSVNNVAPPGYGGPIRRDAWIHGIGRTEWEFTYGGIGFHSSRVETLNGYQKVGQSPQGTIHPDSFYGVTTSVPDEVDPAQFRVYPNPVKEGPVFIHCDSCPLPERVDCISASGQVVRSFQPVFLPIEVPVNDLAGGVYFLKMQFAGGQQVVKKVVVQ